VICQDYRLELHFACRLVLTYAFVFFSPKSVLASTAVVM
jgi:hypothetical protein